MTRIVMLLALTSVATPSRLATLATPRAEPVDHIVATVHPRPPWSEFMNWLKRAWQPMQKPQPTAAECQAALLASTLATVRQSIELYTLQHDNTRPTHLAMQLAEKTDRTGQPGSDYGPYLRPAFPANPISRDPRVRNLKAMPAAPVGERGWLYCKRTGELRANVTGTGPGGTAFFDF